MKYAVFHGLFYCLTSAAGGFLSGINSQSYGGLWLQRNALQMAENFYWPIIAVKYALISQLQPKQNLERTAQ
ncbi:hypothetical protein [Hymenobacter negativus]|uniref:Uncharacterized protein n=1 Tax=Hymenobacter negativus TaxID=2795026 RepID=A0ABS0Q5V8_9BACT|nr:MULTISPECIES: hypothetical protein [Bacteria]MBH8558051.1 hypothetical protein [Hymenobacter negativus]MBH8568541.1 hypothetical protein [Hymenobacter negativus]MBR7208275.1 hypothetical protein [Microvirga sp. STS02]